MQNRLPWHGCASSVRRWGFSMPGERGNERDETEVTPSHVLQRILPLPDGCNPRSSGDEALNFARGDAFSWITHAGPS